MGLKKDTLIRIYSAALWFYPPGFRSEYAEEMMGVFAERLEDKEKERIGLIIFVIRDLLSHIPTAMREYMKTAAIKTSCLQPALSNGANPVIISSLIMALGLGFSQIFLFVLQRADSQVLEIFSSHFVSGFAVLIACESVSLGAARWLSIKGKRSAAPALFSVAVGATYFVGTGLFIRVIQLINQKLAYSQKVLILDINGLLQSINSPEKSVWILVAALGEWAIGFFVGVLIEAANRRRGFDFRGPLFIATAFSLAYLIGHGLYLLMYSIADMNVAGPYLLPFHLYSVAIYAVSRGIVIGLGLGQYGLGKPEEIVNSALQVAA